MENHAHSIRHQLSTLLLALLLPMVVGSDVVGAQGDGQFQLTAKWISFQSSRAVDLWKVEASEVDMISDHVIVVDGDLVAFLCDKDFALWNRSALHVTGIEVSYSTLLARLDRGSGKPKWVFPIWLGQQYSNPVIFKGDIYVGLGPYLQRHDASTGVCLRRWFIGRTMQLKTEEDCIRIFPHFDDKHTADRLKEFHYAFNGDKVLERTFPGSNFLPYLTLIRCSGAVPKFSALGGASGGADCYLNQKSMLPVERRIVDIDLAAVEQFFRGLVALDPGNPQYHFYLGQALTWQERKAEAEAEFLEAVKDREELAFWEYGWLGQEFEFLYMPEWADRCYEVMQAKYFHLVPYRPPYSVFVTRLVTFPSSRRPAVLLYSSGNHARAAALYRIQKRVFPFCEGDDIFAYYYGAWLERNNMLPEAEAEERYSEAASKNPFSQERHLQRTNLWVNLWTGAFAALLIALMICLFHGVRRLFKGSPIPAHAWRFVAVAAGLWLVLSACLYVVLNQRFGLVQAPLNFPIALGDPENELFIRDMISKKPNDSYGHFLLGLSLHMQERTEEAKKEYEKAINLGEVGEAKNNWGVIRISQEKGDDEATTMWIVGPSNRVEYYYNFSLRDKRRHSKQAFTDLWKARMKDAGLVELQEKFLPDQFMLAPVDPEKTAHFLKEWRSPAVIVKQFLGSGK